MRHSTRSIRIFLPRLSDQAAVSILEFLEQVHACFESRYGDQIRRYYDERSEHNLHRPQPPQILTDDPL